MRTYRDIGDGRTLGAAEADDARTLTVTWDSLAEMPAKAPGLSGLELLNAIARGEIPGPPIHHVLGIHPVEAEHGRVVFAMDPHEMHYNPMGVVHGGVLSTILDSALGCTVLSTLPAGTAYTTVDLHVTMVRAVTSRTGRIRAEGKIVHNGRTIATADARLVDAEGRVYAHGVTTCSVMRM